MLDDRGKRNRSAFCKIMEQRYGPPRGAYYHPPHRDDVPAWTELGEHTIMTKLFVTGDPWEHIRKIADECMAQGRPAISIGVMVPFGGYSGRAHRQRAGISVVSITV